MKKNFLLATGMVMMLGACTSSTTTSEDKDAKVGVDSMQVFNLDTTTLAVGTAYYQCPMHLEIISDKPGACPTCQMDLEQMTKQ